MTTFKCRACGAHWSAGPTRDMDHGKECRECIERRLEVRDAAHSSLILAVTRNFTVDPEETLEEALDLAHHRIRKAAWEAVKADDLFSSLARPTLRLRVKAAILGIYPMEVDG